jgi:hypothetical protein
MTWTKSVTPHHAIHIAVETLTPAVVFGFMRTGLVIGTAIGLSVGIWHRNDFKQPYEQWTEARARAAELAAEQCRAFPNSIICRKK